MNARFKAIPIAALIAAILLSAGCGTQGGGGPTDAVTGKVTLNGAPVAGNVTFIGPDGKTASDLIAQNGSYTINNPPKGECNITVMGAGGGGGAGLTPAKDVKVDAGGGAGAGGTPPPPKYAKPGNGLKFTVTGGKQTFDITLTP